LEGWQQQPGQRFAVNTVGIQAKDSVLINEGLVAVRVVVMPNNNRFIPVPVLIPGALIVFAQDFVPAHCAAHDRWILISRQFRVLDVDVDDPPQ